MDCTFCARKAVVEIILNETPEDVCMAHYFDIHNASELEGILQVYDSEAFFTGTTE